MRIFALLVFVPLQIVFLPLAILGVLLQTYRQMIGSRRLGVSQTGIEVLGGRWTMHIFGMREDEATMGLARVLPNFSGLGMWAALQQQREGHVVLMTDADLSTNLGQCGLLVDPILNGGADAAIGSRREPTSVVVKKGVRNTRGKLFIYLWKQILPELAGIVDTQCGFKAFRAGPLRETLSDMIEMQFAFDIELLIKTGLRRRDSIRKVAIAWIDSEAESTTTDLQPYLPMLRKMVEMSR
ncbi:MAG: hypothetical protein IFJ96_07305, partial [Acidobacteria bacterium]|nr:hypothetical protein [Candidatus Sulfomarinibacter sp. MAG AM2]